MLIEFSVKNFLSIKDKITLSMVASKDTTHENNIIKTKNNKKSLNILKTAVIYGPNASGKTNVLKAIAFMINFLKNSHEMQQGKKIPTIPFKLDKACRNQPSEFEIIFKYKDIKYAYGFSITENEVIEEYLYYYPRGRQATIFERWNTNQYKFTNDVEKQKQIVEKFDSKNKLYISTASLWEYEKTKLPFEWLTNYMDSIFSHEPLINVTASLMKENKEFELQVKNSIKKIINDIEDISITEIDIDNNPLLKILNDEVIAKLSDKLNKPRIINISTFHKIKNNDNSYELVEFDLEEESYGTQKLFGLLGPLIDVLNRGSTLIVDELDIRLHTHLTRNLIQLFHDPNVNKNNAQLIFTTHDTNLLDQELFRRDQVWFTEKKEDHSTDLYSLDDFSVRKNANFEKGYLQGKYGAIPYFEGDWIWE